MNPDVLAAYFEEAEALQKEAVAQQIVRWGRPVARWLGDAAGKVTTRAGQLGAEAGHALSAPIRAANEAVGTTATLGRHGYVPVRSTSTGFRGRQLEGVSEWVRDAQAPMKRVLESGGWYTPRGAAARVGEGFRSVGRTLQNPAKEIREGWHHSGMGRMVDGVAKDIGAGAGTKALGVGLGVADFAGSAKQDPEAPQKGLGQRMAGAAGRTLGFFAGQRGGMISGMVASELMGRGASQVGRAGDAVARTGKQMHEIRKMQKARLAQEAQREAAMTPRPKHV